MIELVREDIYEVPQGPAAIVPSLQAIEARFTGNPQGTGSRLELCRRICVGTMKRPLARIESNFRHGSHDDLIEGKLIMWMTRPKECLMAFSA